MHAWREKEREKERERERERESTHVHICMHTLGAGGGAGSLVTAVRCALSSDLELAQRPESSHSCEPIRAPISTIKSAVLLRTRTCRWLPVESIYRVGLTGIGGDCFRLLGQVGGVSSASVSSVLSGVDHHGTLLR